MKCSSSFCVSLPGDEAGCWEPSFPWLSQAAYAVRDGGASLKRCSATQSGAHIASGPSAAASVWASAGGKKQQKTLLVCSVYSCWRGKMQLCKQKVVPQTTHVHTQTDQTITSRLLRSWADLLLISGRDLNLCGSTSGSKACSLWKETRHRVAG